ncbi:MAG TPA: mannose-1-phosphate guanylyltransferase [Deltaproteobacteria bacterium]|nr:mannose-1-phosphate guanylyltransferase [Deltaproteobacteria bacterium]
MEHTYGVIMAGGKGERFWPLSTKRVPKPFIRLLATNTMIQMTVERLLKIVPEDRIMVVLGAEHLAIAQEQLSLWPAVRYLVEPAGRDTAPCIGLAAVTLQREDPKALMVVVPSDHYIPDQFIFVETMRKGIRLARDDARLVTTGIKPTRPETGYGYIQAGKRLPSDVPDGCFEVRRFVEKPDARRAADYLAEGGYYWNSGIFIWQADTVLRGIARHMPRLDRGLQQIRAAMDAGDEVKKDEFFCALEKRSIDYGLMEKAENVVMLEAGFIWDDVGTWSSLQRVLPADERGNCIHGEAVCVDTKGCVIYGEDVPVGTIGLENLIVVASKRGVLVCPKDRDQDARKIAGHMENDD